MEIYSRDPSLSDSVGMCSILSFLRLIFDSGGWHFFIPLPDIPITLNLMLDLFKRSLSSSKQYWRDEMFKCIKENCFLVFFWMLLNSVMSEYKDFIEFFSLLSLILVLIWLVKASISLVWKGTMCLPLWISSNSWSVWKMKGF